MANESEEADGLVRSRAVGDSPKPSTLKECEQILAAYEAC